MSTQHTYLNGDFILHKDAYVHVDDRGFLFADGIYEVVLVYGGKAIDMEEHHARMERSLSEFRIDNPLPYGTLCSIVETLIEKSSFGYGGVYLQVTRGVSPRYHAFPVKPVSPTVLVTFFEADVQKDWSREEPATVKLLPDLRWKCPYIKSVSLLPNILAKQQAKESGAFEAILFHDDIITEGSSSNIFIIDGDNALITHPGTNEILNGVTRCRLIELAKKDGMVVHERPFTVAELKTAREAFTTATVSKIVPIGRVDDAVIAETKAGPVTQRLLSLYEAYIQKEAQIMASV